MRRKLPKSRGRNRVATKFVVEKQNLPLRNNGDCQISSPNVKESWLVKSLHDSGLAVLSQTNAQRTSSSERLALNSSLEANVKTFRPRVCRY